MLRIDPKTGIYSAEIKHRTFGRIHISLRTKKEREAMNRHSALEMLLNEGEPVADLVEMLRKRKLTIEAVTACVRDKLPFASLRKSDAWPELGAAADAFVAFLAGRDEDKGSVLGTAHSTSAALKPAIAFFGADTRLDAIEPDAVAAFRRFMSAPRLESADEKDASTLAEEAAAAWQRDRAGWGDAIGSTVSGLGLKSNTVALYLTRFGAVYTWHQERENKTAQRKKRLPRTLYLPLDRDEHVPALVKTRVRFLYEEEAIRLLTATPPRWKFAVASGFLAGFRAGEMLNLRPAPFDIDLEQEQFVLQVRVGWKPKHGINREIPITPELRPHLDQHLELYAGEQLMHPGRQPDRSFDMRHFQRTFDRIVEDAGLIPGNDHPQGVTYHVLRHTFASWLVMEGVDLLTVARLMGHATIKQVVETYGHLSPEHRKKAVVQLGARWSKALAAAPATAMLADVAPAAVMGGPDARSTQMETQNSDKREGLRR
ncbi:MAG TPA: site-specific integrase [Gemmatimonadaceae bacterium]